MLNLILNLVPISMKKTRIEITHQIENKHVFYLINPDKLNSFEIERIKKGMIFVNGKQYNIEKDKD